MRRLAFLLLLCSACTVQHVPPTVPTLAQQRIAVLSHRIGWLADTVPLLRFNTPYAYGFWRLQVEACSGKTRDGWPRFFVAPIAPLGSDRLAFYDPEGNVIVFSLGSETQDWVFRHEMLHFLMAPTLKGDPHSDEYFGVNGKCGSLVHPAS